MKNDDDIMLEIKNPEKSIFVSANAGSGKTFILVSRVIGLLLKGVEGRKILCISFTEVAAQEMKERIKADLQNIKTHKLLQNASKAEIEKAETLYEEVVIKNNMPRILTFHGFCMEVIRAFSYEAELFYKPFILTTGRQKMIKKEIYRNLFLKQETKSLLRQIKFAFTNFTIENKILPQILKLNFNKKAIELVYSKLGVLYFTNDLKEKIGQMEGEFLSSFDFASLAKILTVFKNTGDKKIEEIEKAFKQKSVSNLTKALLTLDLKQSKRFISKKHKEVLPEIEELYESLCFSLTNFIEYKNKIVTAKITESIMLLTESITDEYERQKQQINSLDFDDLIKVTQTALAGENKDFILFKIDGGLEHILVDEAQDTNFTQWSILFNILEEFFGGIGRSEVPKSLFVVGDEKQSIFRFQGSEPQVFEFVKQKYAQNLEVFYLAKSYRSSFVILNLVDEIFESRFPNYKKHIANFDLYGIAELVELPVKPTVVKKESELWQMPWDESEDEVLKDVQARQITEKIIEILKTKRAVPSDFMLLSAFRDAELFYKIKTILQKHDIGVSFGDEVELSESYIINDFLALLKFLLNEGQRLSLAIILKSPIFGFDDEKFEDFFTNERQVPDEISELKFLLNGTLEGFFTHLIITFGKYYTQDEIKEASYIFNLIYEYKQKSGSSFEGFVCFLEELKEMNYKFKINFTSSNKAVKISTVHASKGLESKIVFILNATDVMSRESAKENFAFGDGFFLVSKKDYQTPLWQELKEEKRKKDYEEYLRLLYVAMTRAKHELYVFGKEIPKEETLESWYTIVKNNLKIKQQGSFEEAAVITEKPENIIYVPSAPLQLNTNKTIYTKASENAFKSKSINFGSLIHFLLENKIQSITPEYIIFFENKFELEKNDILIAFEIATQTKVNFAYMFEKNVYSEVEVVTIDEMEINKSKIDKLILKEGEVWIIDFKYYAKEFITPDIKNQLKVYKKAIKKIYQDCKIRCFVLWLKNQILEEIS